MAPEEYGPAHAERGGIHGFTSSSSTTEQKKGKMENEYQDFLLFHGRYTTKFLHSRWRISQHGTMYVLTIFLPYTISPGTLLPFCFANKKIHQEAFSSWIRRTRFVVRRAHTECCVFNTLLGEVQGHKHILMLSLTDPIEYRWIEETGISLTNLFEFLAQQCPGLRSLLVEIEDLSLWAFTNYGLGPKMHLRPCQGLELFMSVDLDILRHVKFILDMPDLSVPRALMERILDHVKDSVEERFRTVVKAILYVYIAIKYCVKQATKGDGGNNIRWKTIIYDSSNHFTPFNVSSTNL